MPVTKTKEDRAVIRALATRSVFEKTDRLLGWDGRVRVLTPVSDNGKNEVPAWTDGRVITLNGTNSDLYHVFFNGFDRESMVWLSGLNYHELAHCFFTPRLHSDMVSRVREKRAFQAMNVLEDQAAETKFVNLYPPAAHYFTATISKMMMGRPKLLATNYILIAGRKFLPMEIKEAFKHNYALQHQIADIERIVDEYTKCIYPGDQVCMTELCVEMQRLIDELDAQIDTDLEETSEHGDGSGPSETPQSGLQEGEPVSEDVQRQAINDLESQEGMGGQPQGVQLAETDQSQDQEDGEESDPDQQSSDSEDRDGLPGGEGAGSFTGISKKWQPEVLDDLLDRIYEQAKASVGNELDSRAKSVKSSERGYTVDASQSPFEERPPETEHIHAARGVEKEFQRLKQKYKPGWHARQETGKVDPNQIGQIRRGRTDVFRRFQPGVNNVLNIEVVLLLDQSGSMFRYSREAGSALWVLHRSMKNIGAEITALGYSDMNACKVLFQRGVDVPRNIRDYYSGGSTHVMPALSEARRIFRVSNKALKLCVIVTDGMFSDGDRVGKTLSEMSEPVAIVGINQDVAQTWKPSSHHALIVSQTIQHPSDLVPFTKNLVMDLASRNYQRTR